MRKLISIILVIIMIAFCFVGCKSQDVNEDEGKLKIVTTIFPPYDFAEQIGGEYVSVSMLLKPGMESHTFDPTPQDIIRVQDADLFIYTGGESDEWVNDLLESDDKKPRRVIVMMDCVDTVQEDIVDGMTQHEEESDEIEYDEHVWTSPKNASKIAQKIAQQLKELDADHKNEYEKNYVEYAKKLNVLDNDIREVVENGKNKMMIFADRFPFRYFADEYNLAYFAAFPGCTADMEPSASTVSFLIKKVKEKNIPVVFTIEFSNGKIADTICEATGAKKLEMNSCHNLSQKMFDKGETYISVMQKNLKNLKEALS